MVLTVCHCAGLSVSSVKRVVTVHNYVKLLKIKKLST